jgi:hypothetical protein
MFHALHTTLRSILVPAATVGMLALASPAALACGGGWWPEVTIDHRIEGVAGAERDLAEGRYQIAAGKVIRMIPHIHAYGAATKDPLVNRSMRVLAVASMRSGGDLSALDAELPEELTTEFAGTSESAKKANLEWSVKALKALRKQKKDDATLKSELAEAMALLPETQRKAKKTLERLAQKDLLTSPEAYRALSKLRASAGDTQGAATAQERCRNMARDASICDVGLGTPRTPVDGES